MLVRLRRYLLIIEDTSLGCGWHRFVNSPVVAPQGALSPRSATGFLALNGSLILFGGSADSGMARAPLYASLSARTSHAHYFDPIAHEPAA